MPRGLALVLLLVSLLILHQSKALATGTRETCEESDMSSGSSRRVLLTSNGLSNKRIREEFSRLARLRQPKINIPVRVLYIPDALIAEGVPQADARAGFERSLLGLTLENKLEVSDLELAHCSSEELRRELEKADVVYVECGNTFYLHYHMVKQMKDGDDNFKSLISPFLDKGLIYVGSSAGTIVAGKTISIALWKGWDDPSVVPKVDYESLEVLKGLSFFPHYSSQWKDLVQTQSAKLPHKVVTLTDDQCYSADETGSRLI